MIDVDAGYAGAVGETGEVSPEQPFYRVFAMGDAGGFVAYAAEAVLEHDADQLSVADEQQWFTIDAQGRHAPFDMRLH